MMFNRPDLKIKWSDRIFIFYKSQDFKVCKFKVIRAHLQEQLCGWLLMLAKKAIMAEIIHL